MKKKSFVGTIRESLVRCECEELSAEVARNCHGDPQPQPQQNLHEVKEKENFISKSF